MSKIITRLRKLFPKPYFLDPNLGLPRRSSFRAQAGFSLIEAIFITFFIGLLSTSLLINLNGARNNITIVERAAAALVSDIRQAQNLAIAGKTSSGAAVCGFGLFYVSPSQYTIYAGSTPLATACASVSRNYDVGTDITVEIKSIIESSVEIKSWVSGDLFFESPDPKTYINNSNAANQILTIILGFKNTTCPASTCKTITVSTSGRIDLP